MNAKLTRWTALLLLVFAAGIGAAVIHAMGERYVNAVIAAGASLVGAVILFFVPDQEPIARRQRAPRRDLRPWRSAPAEVEPNRRWLSGSVIAGFAATTVMSMLLVLAYLTVGYVGSEDGGQLSRWLYGLKHNELTDGVYDIPLAAFSVNLLAGLLWAIVYGRFAEPRIPGSGWWKGMVFSLAPWLLSLIAFFPLVGAGFFGSELNAGPLPAIGNLVLHLIYGLVLGGTYALPDVSAGVDEMDAGTARMELDGTALGLVIGLSTGVAVGAVLSIFVADGAAESANVILAAGGFGTFGGALIGPMVAMGHGTHEVG